MRKAFDPQAAFSAALPALCLGLGALVAYTGAQSRTILPPAPRAPSFESAGSPQGGTVEVQSVETLNNYQGGMDPTLFAFYKDKIDKGFRALESMKIK